MLIRPDKEKILLIDPKIPTVSPVERGQQVFFLEEPVVFPPPAEVSVC